MHWLVVMDINMPRLNGLDAVSELRHNPAWAKLPVLLLSTSDDQQTVDEALRRGANGYLVKPSTMSGYTSLFDQYFAPWLASESNRWPVYAEPDRR